MAETSRLRTERRRRTAASILAWQSPRWEGAELPQYQPREDRRRGHWYPVSACCIVPLGDDLTLLKRAGGRVDRIGVFRCGSVHTCPSCAQRISVPRAKQIANVIEAARAAGHLVFMVTYTQPHDAATPLIVLIERVHAAMRLFVADGTVRRRLAEWGYVGHVNSYECTLALAEDKVHDNGWHYHCHAVVVLGKDDELGARGVTHVSGQTKAHEDYDRASILKELLWHRWRDASLRAGSPRPPSHSRGLDVRPVWNANDYIQKQPEKAKLKEDVVRAEKKARGVKADDAAVRDETARKRWGAEAEMTKSYVKEGREKSRTPFQLLDDPTYRDIELYREYARSTFGRSTLEWSRGNRDLRDIFLGDGVYVDMSDEECAAAEPEWTFADEVDEEGNPIAPASSDIVVDQADVPRNDCWRARRLGRNAMDRAVDMAERDGVDLPTALRACGFDVELVSTAWTDVEYSEHVVTVTKNGPGGWLVEVRRTVRVETPIHHPNRYIARYPGHN